MDTCSLLGRFTVFRSRAIIFHGDLAFDNGIGTQSRLSNNSVDFCSFGETSSILSSLLDIYEANSDHRSGADSKQEGKPHPVVASVINYGLNDVRSDDGRLNLC